jgi:excisionase family DNA binding protein
MWGMIMAIPETNGALLTVTEAAEVVGCTGAYLRRLLRSGDPRISGIPAGPRAWMVHAASLEQFKSQLTSRSRGKRPAFKPKRRRRKER